MAGIRRPSLLNRALSTPPATPSTTTATTFPTMESKTQPGYSSSSVLTPPTSPRQSRSSSNISALALSVSSTPTHLPLEIRTLQDLCMEATDTNANQQQISKSPDVIDCPFEVELLKDERGRDALFGTGAWSNVCKAITRAKLNIVAGSLTPPLSPTVTRPLLVAVKKPARRDAVTILKSEAKTLSYLRSVPTNDKYVVPFYGVIDEATIVMEAMPFTLEDHIRRSTTIASQSYSSWNMTEPVLGSTVKWFHLAQKLISALAWLHDEAQVVHGDIKPGNILLTSIHGSGSDMTFEPVFADFSSSQRLDLPETTPNTLSAVTREYTAPELLSSKVLRDPDSTATTASDVFSMAITLLVAATGQLMVYPGSVFQRQAMATQGWMVLGHVRNGDGGTRVQRSGVVEKVLEKAVLKVDMGRISAPRWSDLVEVMAKGEPAKI